MFRNYRWYIVFILFLAAIINYIDRTALSVAMPFISKRFHLDPAEMGMILSSFFIGYALFNFIGGYFSDVIGPKKVFAVSMTVWSIFCGLTAMTFSFTSLFIVRLMFGIGEGPFSSTANKAVNNWFPIKERARAVGINQAGLPIGGAISGPIVGLIALHWGWEWSFVVITLIGLLWTVIWVKTVTDRPQDHPKVSKAELQVIRKGQQETTASSSSASLPLSHYIKQPTVLVTAIAFFAYNYIIFFFLTWFPSYLTMAKHLSIMKMSVVTMIPWSVGALGLIGGGIITDYIYNKTGKLMFSRKVVLVTCLLGSAVCVGLTGIVSSVNSIVTLMALGICFLYMTASIYWAIIQDTVIGEKVGGVSGFVHGLANISGIIGPTVTGLIVQYTGKFTSAFLLAGGLAIIGALAVAFFVKPLQGTLEKNERAEDMLSVRRNRDKLEQYSELS
ncbi:MFS transporter [Aneurinibacillus sp. Ricciae_BoGa-3]|uniref:MFS transporter n=1 Tax=Aneurinibacillus sp. Ricciae_BoGa-3 TaxID=3022697 RepID=UPI0023403715|nr:MFS transporter [Aneurinibacillus sp. Ricciae_BoGa-3]WCK56406.1 MFS transporter [Aneurinibacillus sp. Ricciae_BoGa-3]